MVWPVRGRAEENGGRAGMEVGGRIRELRAAAGMSQDDLAARVYVSRQTISSWENGKTTPTSRACSCSPRSSARPWTPSSKETWKP
ncbi:MAG: helix-turn-helix transcriptional regulator [Collinsella intestinalis]